MSYNVYFDKQFVKTKDNKFITLALIGDSSLWQDADNGKEKMVRNWGMVTPILDEQGVLDYYKDIMDSHMERYDTGKDNILFGMGTRIPGKENYNDMLNWLKTGMKKAITFEQLKDAGYGLRVTAYDGDDRVFSEQFFTEEEVLSKYYEAKKKHSSVFISTYWGEYFGKRMRQLYFPRARKGHNKEMKVVEEFFTIGVRSDRHGDVYLARNGSTSFTYSFEPYKKYLSEAKAQRLVDKYNKKYPYRKYWVEKITSPTRMYV